MRVRWEVRTDGKVEQGMLIKRIIFLYIKCLGLSFYFKVVIVSGAIQFLTSTINNYWFYIKL